MVRSKTRALLFMNSDDKDHIEPSTIDDMVEGAARDLMNSTADYLEAIQVIITVTDRSMYFTAIGREKITD